MNEKLLNSWINVITNIRNNRFMKELSLNEVIIIRYIKEDPDITASKLCDILGLLKSQMNRTLDSMEIRGLLIRERHIEDKRKIRLVLTPKGNERYLVEHKHISNIFSEIIGELGEEDAETLSVLLDKAVTAIRKVDND